MFTSCTTQVAPNAAAQRMEESGGNFDFDIPACEWRSGPKKIIIVDAAISCFGTSKALRIIALIVKVVMF